MAAERIQHVALRIREKEKLLVVLSVDIGKVRRQALEQRYGNRPAADVGARFAAGQDFAFDQQFAIFDFEAGGSSSGRTAEGSRTSKMPATRARDLAGADHIGGGAAAQQQAERVHHDGFAAAGFPREQIQAGVKVNAQALDHRVIFDHELEEHPEAIIAGRWVRPNRSTGEQSCSSRPVT